MGVNRPTWHPHPFTFCLQVPALLLPFTASPKAPWEFLIPAGFRHQLGPWPAFQKFHTYVPLVGSSCPWKSPTFWKRNGRNPLGRRQKPPPALAWDDLANTSLCEAIVHSEPEPGDPICCFLDPVYLPAVFVVRQFVRGDSAAPVKRQRWVWAGVWRQPRQGQ